MVREGRGGGGSADTARVGLEGSIALRGGLSSSASPRIHAPAAQPAVADAEDLHSVAADERPQQHGHRHRQRLEEQPRWWWWCAAELHPRACRGEAWLATDGGDLADR